MQKIIAILNARNIDLSKVESSFVALVTKHEDAIEKALNEAKGEVNFFDVAARVLEKEEGISISVKFPKAKKESMEVKSFREALGVKEHSFNWKKAALIGTGVAATAGLGYGTYRWVQKRRSADAEAAVVNA